MFVGNKHLQASSTMFFEVFRENEPDHLLIRQAFEEVLNEQLEEVRFRGALQRINQQQIRIMELEQVSPFCFPIMVDRFREKLSSEKLEDRIKKMQMERF
jgi:ATP-dependent Lhr-like helicase